MGWEREVASTCVESGGEVALLDPLAPADDDEEAWSRLDARPPTMVVILKPDHVRDVDLFVRRYGAVSIRRPGVVASIYTYGDSVYGFALTLPTEPVCQ